MRIFNKKSFVEFVRNNEYLYIDNLVNDWYEERENLDVEFRDLKFGGISDLDCFLEIIFDEEDCYKIYLLGEK